MVPQHAVRMLQTDKLSFTWDILEIVRLSISQENVQSKRPKLQAYFPRWRPKYIIYKAFFFERFLEKYLTVQALRHLRWKIIYLFTTFVQDTDDDRENLKGLCHVSGVMSGKKLYTLIFVYHKLYLLSKTYETWLTYCGLHNNSQTTEQGLFGPNLKN